MSDKRYLHATLRYHEQCKTSARNRRRIYGNARSTGIDLKSSFSTSFQTDFGTLFFPVFPTSLTSSNRNRMQFIINRLQFDR